MNNTSHSDEILPSRRPRLLVLTSHAIQYQAPLFRAMAKDPRFSTKVLLCSDVGATSYRDAGFGREVKWDIPLLEGYDHAVLPNWSPFPNPSRPLGLINPGVLTALWSGEFDALMVLTWSNVTTWLAIAAALLQRIPIILKPEATSHRQTRGRKAVLKRGLLGWFFRRCAAILASGKHGAEFFLEYGAQPEKVVIAPYAVDNDFFFSRAEALRPRKQELRSKLNLPASTPLVTFVGKLYPGKRPFDLLQAFAALRKKHGATLVFVGDGESRSELEHWTRANHVPDVHFAGFRNQTELPEYLATSDVFVLPSELETWGLVVNEAMCFGLPIIATDRVGAGGDLVHSGENGFLYAVGDVEALTGHLEKLASSPGLRAALGQRSIEIIRAWSYNENLDAVAAVLQQMFPADSFPK